MATKDLTAEMRALEVGIDHPIPIVVGDFQILDRRVDTGAVHENVGLAAGVLGCSGSGSAGGHYRLGGALLDRPARDVLG